MSRLSESMWNARTNGERAGGVIALLLVCIGVAALLVARSGPTDIDDQDQFAASPVPACADVPSAKLHAGRVTCRSGGKLLVIADGLTPVLLRDTDVKVYQSRMEGDQLALRVRVRNHSGVPHHADGDRQQFYLNLPPGRLRAVPLRSGDYVDSGRAKTINLRFDLPPAAIARLNERNGVVGLGVVPFSQLGSKRPTRLGVIRLYTDPKHPAPKRKAAEDEPPPSAGAPACKDITASERKTGRFMCRTSTATLVVAGQGKPVVFQEVAVRAFGAHQQGGTVTVRVRVNNPTKGTELVHTDDQMFFLNVRPQKVWAQIDRRHVIEPGTTEVMDLNFPLTPAAQQQLSARGGIVGLGVIPFGSLDDHPPDRIGNIKLHVQPG